MAKKLWSGEVTEHETTGAEFLPEGLFKKSSKEIAEGLKKAVRERYEVEGLDPNGEYRSAMSMLDFYINRAGKNLSNEDKDRLDAAKRQLQSLFGKA